MHTCVHSMWKCINACMHEVMCPSPLPGHLPPRVISLPGSSPRPVLLSSRSISYPNPSPRPVVSASRPARQLCSRVRGWPGEAYDPGGRRSGPGDDPGEEMIRTGDISVGKQTLSFVVMCVCFHVYLFACLTGCWHTRAYTLPLALSRTHAHR